MLSHDRLFCYPRDCSLLDSPVHGIVSARILEWTSIPSARGSSQPQKCVCFIAGRVFTAEPPEKPRRVVSAMLFVVPHKGIIHFWKIHRSLKIILGVTKKSEQFYRAQNLPSRVRIRSFSCFVIHRGLENSKQKKILCFTKEISLLRCKHPSLNALWTMFH